MDWEFLLQENLQKEIIQIKDKKFRSFGNNTWGSCSMNGMDPSDRRRPRPQYLKSQVFAEIGVAIAKRNYSQITRSDILAVSGAIERALSGIHLVVAPVGLGRWATFKCCLRRTQYGFQIYRIRQVGFGHARPECADRLVNFAQSVPAELAKVGIDVRVDFES